ncbi:hypothetical protein JCM19233_7296 [Vibrio astriarenae]|nr:hypothetical protein JCM19233_7296 [Vibrio sp. C7]
MFQNEVQQLEKVQRIVAELLKRSDQQHSDQEAIQLASFIGRANNVIHKLQVQIEHKNIVNHEVDLLVDEWNELRLM